jgi:fibronectin-binding autotransporter adhesin
MAVAIVLAASISAHAQTWDGSDSTDMSDGNNWVGGVAPGPGANIVITGPAVLMPTIDGDTVTANILYVGHDATDGGAELDLINGAA